jgi:NAD(P)H-nitrite reductase large subunit
MRDDLFVRAPSLSEPYRKREGKGKDCPIEGDTLDAVIFTGGVCKSAHLQQKVKAALESNPPELEQMGINNVTRRTRYHVPDDSQVCVCKGLVYARLQEVSTTNDKWYKSFFDNLRI